MSTTIKKVLYDAEIEEEVEVEFPAKWVVCPDCRGEGTTYLGWPAKDQPAFTREDFEYEGPDFYEDYMEGRYDKDCPNCKGRTTVKEVDEQFIRHKGGDLLSKYNIYLNDLREEAEYQKMVEMERRMGA